MSQITTKELTALEDQLNAEQTLVKKCNTYADQFTDPQLQVKCNLIAEKHQEYFNTLIGYLK